MSKYDGLWQYVALSGADALELGFDEIGTIAGGASGSQLPERQKGAGGLRLPGGEDFHEEQGGFHPAAGEAVMVF